jgi:hypothetical protein
LIHKSIIGLFLMAEFQHSNVQIRHNGRVTEGLFAGRPLGEKIGRDPKKGQPLSDRVILMSFREWR